MIEGVQATNPWIPTTLILPSPLFFSSARPADAVFDFRMGKAVGIRTG